MPDGSQRLKNINHFLFGGRFLEQLFDDALPDVFANLRFLAGTQGFWSTMEVSHFPISEKFDFAQFRRLERISLIDCLQWEGCTEVLGFEPAGLTTEVIKKKVEERMEKAGLPCPAVLACAPVYKSSLESGDEEKEKCESRSESDIENK